VKLKWQKRFSDSASARKVPKTCGVSRPNTLARGVGDSRDDYPLSICQRNS
jgi:hypothetical protein